MHLILVTWIYIYLQDFLKILTVHKKQKWLNQVGFQTSRHMISQENGVETAPDQKEKLWLKITRL